LPGVELQAAAAAAAAAGAVILADVQWTTANSVCLLVVQINHFFNTP
jgi:hypothetical protein